MLHRSREKIPTPMNFYHIKVLSFGGGVIVSIRGAASLHPKPTAKDFRFSFRRSFGHGEDHVHTGQQRTNNNNLTNTFKQIHNNLLEINMIIFYSDSFEERISLIFCTTIQVTTPTTTPRTILPASSKSFSCILNLLKELIKLSFISTFKIVIYIYLQTNNINLYIYLSMYRDVSLYIDSIYTLSFCASFDNTYERLVASCKSSCCRIY